MPRNWNWADLRAGISTRLTPEVKPFSELTIPKKPFFRLAPATIRNCSCLLYHDLLDVLDNHADHWIPEGLLSSVPTLFQCNLEFFDSLGLISFGKILHHGACLLPYCHDVERSCSKSGVHIKRWFTCPRHIISDRLSSVWTATTSWNRKKQWCLKYNITCTNLFY